MIIYNGRYYNMSVLDKIIGLVAPPSCLICQGEGSALCESCANAEVIPYGEHCWNCGARSFGGRTCPKCRHTGTPRHVWLATTYENAAQELIKLYKFGNLRPAADTIANLMVETFRNFNNDSPAYLVVPVPTATSRVRNRGFDHSALLAREVAKLLKQQYLPVLGRLGQERQVGKSRQDRLSQIDDKFYLKSNLVKGQKILLIDDVVTTGGTLRSATKVLRAAGVKQVDALIFAKRL